MYLRLKTFLANCLNHWRRKGDDYWDARVRHVRSKGGDPQDVSLPPGILFFENQYLWERAVMEPISGRKEDTPLDWFYRTFIKAKANSVLSISCGTGLWERRISEMGFAARIDAFDYSQACLEWARELAARQGLTNINYWQADVNEIRLEQEKYDFVVSFAALHHVENLEHVLKEISRSLKPGGFFFYDEYIGPNRLQWPDEEVEIANRILAIIPRRYRKQITGGVKKRVKPIPVERMIKLDPTEAVRSEDILPLTSKYFKVLEKREYGGAILMPLFMQIIGNYNAAEEEDQLILDFCLSLEKVLMKNGVITANGAVVVCRKRPGPPACE